MKRNKDETYTCKNCGKCVSKIIKCDGLCLSCYRKQPRIADRIRASRKKTSVKNEEERFQAGLCVKCGAKKEQLYLLCARCRENGRKQQRKDRDKRRALRLESGICVVCGKRPAVDGRAACEVCWKTKRYVIENIKEIRL